MRLRHQALIAGLAAACLGCGGCARLLSAFLAPQQAAMSTANQVAGKVTSPAQSELAGMNQEVDRLLGAKGANQEELTLIKRELTRMDPTRQQRDGSAQGDPERLRPWHPRVAEPDAKELRTLGTDDLALGPAVHERGLPVDGRLPDGVPPAEMRTPISLSKIRIEKPR